MEVKEDTSLPESQRLAMTWLRKAKVLYEAGEVEEALHAVEMVLKWDADNEEAHQLKAQIGSAVH